MELVPPVGIWDVVGMSCSGVVKGEAQIFLGLETVLSWGKPFWWGRQLQSLVPATLALCKCSKPGPPPHGMAAGS